MGRINNDEYSDAQASVDTFLAQVDPIRRRSDAHTLDALFQKVTRFTPRMWGPSIIGYGAYHYTYDSGRKGVSLATGFSPRKANLVIYIMPGYTEFGHILKDLGKHKKGKSCLYINKLDDVDTGVLQRLIQAGLEDLATKWPVLPDR